MERRLIPAKANGGVLRMPVTRDILVPDLLVRSVVPERAAIEKHLCTRGLRRDRVARVAFERAVHERIGAGDEEREVKMIESAVFEVEHAPAVLGECETVVVSRIGAGDVQPPEIEQR